MDSVKLWQQAAAFAAEKHRHQTRKDGRTPYIAHPMRVALTVSQVFGVDDPAALAAALLHDTIEDTTADYDDINERFGGEVAEVVAALSMMSGTVVNPQGVPDGEADVPRQVGSN